MAAPVGVDRAQVIDAGVAVLEERGRLDAVSLAQVASRIGIRTQSLYAHVDGLDGLRRALALHGLSALGERLAAAAAGRVGGEAIDAIVRAYYAFAIEHPGLYDASLQPPGRDPELRDAMTVVMGPLNLVFDRYGLDAAASLHWYRIVFAGVHGFAALRRDGLLTMPGDPGESLGHMIRAFVHQIEAEAAAAGPGASHRR